MQISRNTVWSESLNMNKTNLSTDHEHIEICHNEGKASSFSKLYLAFNIIIEY